MLKVINSATLRDDAVAGYEKNKNGVLVPVFRGGMEANLNGGRDMAVMLSVKPEVANGNINDLAYRAKNAQEALKAKNSADAPDTTALTDFFGKYFIDLQRQTQEAGDLTSLIANEVTDFEMPKTPSVRDYEPFRGQMKTVSGENDAVPLIQQNTGNLDTFSLDIKAVGWKDSLANLLYNKWFSMDKVVKAAADAYVDQKNAATCGVIVGTTYAASQKEAFDTTSDLTPDQHTYQTMLNAVKKIRQLKDIYTKRKIPVPSLSVLCNSADTWQVTNVIKGQLDMNGGGATGRISPALPIGQIIEYDQGLCDGFTIGKETASFPGVTAGTCYLFVPGVMMIGNKRPLTMEAGMGSVLELSTEERAWYAVFGGFYKQFLGSSAVGATCGAGYGYIVEVKLA
jgi:hypothetical protein